MRKNILYKCSRFVPLIIIIAFVSTIYWGCDYATHRTISKENTNYEEPDPDYDVSLNSNYQEFTSFMFLGNRAEAFGTYFNKFFTANEDYTDALKEYSASTIAMYNRRLDSLNVVPQVQQTTKEKFLKVIERCSKIIQYNKNTKYFDKAVLLIGKSYYYSGEYMQAERKFNEFLSRLSSSDLKDEALLYLGLTKFRLARFSEGESILKNLFVSTKEKYIKAEVLQELSIYNISLKNYKDAIDQLKNSIELTSDNEKKAERQFILAKIYTTYSKEKAPEMYRAAYKNTSEFDFEFYALLNEVKSVIALKKFKEAEPLLNKLNKKYVDYPDLKQLAELEVANNLFYQKDFNTSKLEYFNLIVKYPGSKAAAESYYQLGNYYENEKSDYLKALIAYKKAIETNPNIDYVEVSKYKSEVLDRYFSLKAIISDSAKIVIPADIPEIEKMKKEKEEELNKDLNKDPNQINKDGNKGKTGGYYSKDTITTEDSILNAFNKMLEEKKANENNVNDTIKEQKRSDTLIQRDKEKKENHIKEDHIKESDSTNVKSVNTDSLNNLKDKQKIDAYFELAEIFYYNLNRTDSTIYYLDKIIADNKEPHMVSKAIFYRATIYKANNELSKAKELFEDIVKNYPNSIYANEARKNLGHEEVLQVYDETDSLLILANRYIASNEKNKTLELLYVALSKNIESPLQPKTIYTMGWVYENLFQKLDSAEKYYSKLKENYPASEYSLAINEKLAYWESLNKKDTTAKKDSTSLIKDSLLLANDTLIQKTDSLNATPKDSLNNLNPENLNPNVLDTLNNKLEKEQKENPQKTEEIEKKKENENKEKTDNELLSFVTYWLWKIYYLHYI